MPTEARPKPRNSDADEATSPQLGELLRKEPSDKVLNKILDNARKLETEQPVDYMDVGEHYIAASRTASKLGQKDRARQYQEKAIEFLSKELRIRATMAAKALASSGVRLITVGINVMGITIEVSFDVNELLAPQPQSYK